MNPFNAPAGTALLPDHLGIIQEIIEGLPHPQEPVETERFADVVDALLRQDGHAIAELLDLPPHRFGGAYLQMECYALVVVALTRLAHAGVTIPGSEAALQTIRHQVRHELMSMPPQLETVWLIPATLRDRTAAHVASLMLIRNARLARPWIWGGLPDHGRFHLIGDGADPRALLRHPYVNHHRCEGPLSFAVLAASWIHSHC